VILAEVAEELVRAVLADRPDEKTISLLAISVSHPEGALGSRAGTAAWT
jgi:DNA polymerase-4